MSKVASKLCSLLAEHILEIMAYFLRGYHTLFWKPHFDWLKIADPIAKVGVHDSRHNSARYFTVRLNIMKLKTTWSAKSEFQQFIGVKELYDDNENKLSHDSLL